jgi:hypothetical protein
MKKHFLLIIITTVFAFFAQVSNAQETDKEVKKAEKELQKLAEKQEKERLKKPAQIEINAPSENIGKLLIKVFKSRNYKVDQTNKRLIELSLIPQQVNTQTAIGGFADRKLIIKLDEKHGKTKVTINIGMLAQNAFGRIGYVSLDSDKKVEPKSKKYYWQSKRKLKMIIRRI